MAPKPDWRTTRCRWRERRGGRRKPASSFQRLGIHLRGLQVRAVLRTVVLLHLSLAVSVLSTRAHPSVGVANDKRRKNGRSCSMDELLPDYTMEGDLSRNWDMEAMVSPPFDCTCQSLKASYYCPNLGTDGYPKWVPQRVADGICKPVTRSSLKHEPFPPGFKIMFYGNSHLRQVVEGIVCAYSKTLRRRRVSLTDRYNMRQDLLVELEQPCRSCLSHANEMLDQLLEYGCVDRSTGTDACRCDDDTAVFEFENGAALHYYFAHKEEGKRIEDGLRVHGTSFADYDLVVANIGNEPRLEVSDLLQTAESVQEEGVPLILLTTYQGDGDIRRWTPQEQERFRHSGARFVPLHDMVESLQSLTKGVVEGEYNPHFCMPGPPNEIGILLLKVAWALKSDQAK